MNSILQEGRTSWVEVAFTILIADGDRVRLRNSNRLYFRENFIVVDVLPVLTAVSIRTRVNKSENQALTEIGTLRAVLSFWDKLIG